MGKLILKAILIYAVAFLVFSLNIRIAKAEDINAKLLKVTDGDTVKVEMTHKNIPGVFAKMGVRILGLDTPEKRGTLPCEQERAAGAKAMTEKLLAGKESITLSNCKGDKYFRLLCDIKLDDGSLLSQRLIDAGLAYPYHGGTKEKRDWCKGKK